jgi:hypothetical protein
VDDIIHAGGQLEAVRAAEVADDEADRQALQEVKVFLTSPWTSNPRPTK